MKGIIYVDIAKCIACKTCELECAIAHSQSQNLWGALIEDPPPQNRITLVEAETFCVPLQCRHCENAPCVAICPTKAMSKAEPGGPVTVKEELCIGCKYCILVCPFGAIKMSRDGKAIIKCDLCIQRLKDNKKPACVQGCPTGALQFVPVEEMVDQVRKRAAENFLVAFKDSQKAKNSLTV